MDRVEGTRIHDVGCEHGKPDLAGRLVLFQI